MIGLGAIMNVEEKTYKLWPAAAARAMAWLQENSFFLWLTLGFVSILGWWFRRRGDPWVWDKLQILLDDFQRVAYRDFAADIRDHHRVTLFRHQKWHWRFRTCMTRGIWPWKPGRYPWSGWLVPVLRSGITSQNTRAVFLAPDDANSAEGVAGRAWGSNRILVVDDLPRITSTSGRTQVTRYARRTFCPEEIVRDYMGRGKDLPRSIGAIPIEVNNKMWGVLVLDSQNEHGVTEDVVNNFTLTVKIIGQMLEKAK